jgi:hypothetical protein
MWLGDDGVPNARAATLYLVLPCVWGLLILGCRCCCATISVLWVIWVRLGASLRARACVCVCVRACVRVCTCVRVSSRVHEPCCPFGREAPRDSPAAALPCG